jgi:hypothetical protein
VIASLVAVLPASGRESYTASLSHKIGFDTPAAAYEKRLARIEHVWKGETNQFRNERSTFTFGSWRDGDANCCPSGGEVTGRFTLEGGKRFDPSKKRWSTEFRIVPTDFVRKPM